MNAGRPVDTVEKPGQTSPAWHAISSADVKAWLGTTDVGLTANDSAGRLPHASRRAFLIDIQNAVLLMTVLFENVYVLCMPSHRRSVLREPLFANPWVVPGVGVAVSFQLIAMIWPALGEVLGTSLVSTTTLWLCLAAMVSAIVFSEVTNQLVEHWQRNDARG